MIDINKFSDEQKDVLKYVAQGFNVLVEACIGSGKTTVIQGICNIMKGKKILYLTYSRLLKFDAQSKIQNSNVDVTNYHSFVMRELYKNGIRGSKIESCLMDYVKFVDRVPHYDMLLIDEYQDIDTQMSEVLKKIKNANRGIQIIAVGDMHQKIYDYTSLDVKNFIDSFLSCYRRVTFTKCFRICGNLADILANAWNMNINGVNINNAIIGYVPEFKKDLTYAAGFHTMYYDDDIEIEDYFNELYEEIKDYKPSDLLILGARKGLLPKFLNYVEKRHPKKFNKNTIYASIKDTDGYINVPDDAAIFTTYDSCKGLERRVCIVFDWNDAYYEMRAGMEYSNEKILTNIFCVAASRGKDKIIFVNNDVDIFCGREYKDTIEESKEESTYYPSDMFEFKYNEDIHECVSFLNIEEIKHADKSIIKIDNKDGLIDLSPCIGIYVQADFFKKYTIGSDILFEYEIMGELKYPHYYRRPDESEDKAMKRYNKELAAYEAKRNDIIAYVKTLTVNEKILLLTSLTTRQDRYRTQAVKEFVNEKQKALLTRRLSTVFSGYEDCQYETKMMFDIISKTSDGKPRTTKAIFSGILDVLKDNVVYELKFVDELKYEHFLQCAIYLIMMKLKYGILWNLRDNKMYVIEIDKRTEFMKSVIKCITKGNASLKINNNDLDKCKNPTFY